MIASHICPRRYSHHVIFILGTVALTQAAVAQQPTPQGLPAEAQNPAVQAAWSACNADIQKFCPAVQPGGGRIVMCLAKARESLTPECRDGMLKAKSALGR